MRCYFLSFISVLFSTLSSAQSVVPIRGDTVRIYKVGGNAEVKIENATRSRTGAFLKNTGNGWGQWGYALDSVQVAGDSLRFRYGTGFLSVKAGGAVDSLLYATRARVKHVSDSLGAILGTKLSAETDPKRITAAAFSGSATKTLTLTQADGGTVTASFLDSTAGGSTATAWADITGKPAEFTPASGSGYYVPNISGTGQATYFRLTGAATDPTGSNGLSSYNTTSNQFRGYRNGAWKNFLMDGDVTTSQPASQILYGTGTGLTSSSVFQWSVPTRRILLTAGSDVGIYAAAPFFNTVVYNASAGPFTAVWKVSTGITETPALTLMNGGSMYQNVNNSWLSVGGYPTGGVPLADQYGTLHVWNHSTKLGLPAAAGSGNTIGLANAGFAVLNWQGTETVHSLSLGHSNTTSWIQAKNNSINGGALNSYKDLSLNPLGGNVIIGVLKTTGTAPAITGQAQVVITDANGAVSRTSLVVAADDAAAAAGGVAVGEMYITPAPANKLRTRLN